MLSKKVKAAAALLLAVSSVLTACGGSAENPDSPAESGKEPVTLTFFDKNTGDAFDNDVAQVIMERTGVKIEVQQPTGNPEEKLNLMLTSGDLPDLVLMDRRSNIVDKYIAAGALVPLNDLIDQYAPNVKEMYGDTLNKSRYEDGKNYYLNNWYGIDGAPDRAYCMRMDVLKELGYGEKAERGEAFTQEEFKDILTKFRDSYTDEDGRAAIPLTCSSEYMSAIIGCFKGMYGMKNYYEKDGELFFEVRDPKYLDMLQYMNSLYREGLLDKEWAVNKDQIYIQKAGSGRVAATIGGVPTDANKVLLSEGEMRINSFICLK